MRMIHCLGLTLLISSAVVADVVNDPETGAQIRASCDEYDVRENSPSHYMAMDVHL